MFYVFNKITFNLLLYQCLQWSRFPHPHHGFVLLSNNQDTLLFCKIALMSGTFIYTPDTVGPGRRSRQKGSVLKARKNSTPRSGGASRLKENVYAHFNFPVVDPCTDWPFRPENLVRKITHAATLVPKASPRTILRDDEFTSFFSCMKEKRSISKESGAITRDAVRTDADDARLFEECDAVAKSVYEAWQKALRYVYEQCYGNDRMAKDVLDTVPENDSSNFLAQIGNRALSIITSADEPTLEIDGVVPQPGDILYRSLAKDFQDYGAYHAAMYVGCNCIVDLWQPLSLPHLLVSMIQEGHTRAFMRIRSCQNAFNTKGVALDGAQWHLATIARASTPNLTFRERMNRVGSAMLSLGPVWFNTFTATCWHHVNVWIGDSWKPVPEYMGKLGNAGCCLIHSLAGVDPSIKQEEQLRSVGIVASAFKNTVAQITATTEQELEEHGANIDSDGHSDNPQSTKAILKRVMDISDSDSESDACSI